MSDLKLGKLLQGLRIRDHKVLSEIYKQYYPIVLNHVLRNNGGDSDAKDVFQETIIIIYKMVEDESFEIKGEFGAYLLGIAKKIWLNHLRKSNIHQRFVSNSEQTSIEDHPSNVEIENESELALIRKHIVNLGEDCRNILMWSAEGMKNSEIAKKLGYKNPDVVYSKKFKCKEALLKLIKSDPNFKG